MEDLIAEQEKLFTELENFNSYAKVPPDSKSEKTIDYADDNRICLTLVYFLPEELRDIITKKIIQLLKETDKEQYYYLPESLHITINNVKIISNPPYFNSEEILRLKSLNDYFNNVNLEFKLQGLFMMSNGIAIKAFPNLTTNNFILDLRDKLEEIGVPDNKSYFNKDVIIGNITLCRFHSEPNEEIKQLIKGMKNFNLGNLRIKNVSLISTNLVCHPDKTKIYHNFK